MLEPVVTVSVQTSRTRKPSAGTTERSICTTPAKVPPSTPGTPAI
ncbi:MAG: hypothetical protein U0894_09840 [Pirellulales bacterium]